MRLPCHVLHRTRPQSARPLRACLPAPRHQAMCGPIQRRATLSLDTCHACETLHITPGCCCRSRLECGGIDWAAMLAAGGSWCELVRVAKVGWRGPPAPELNRSSSVSLCCAAGTTSPAPPSLRGCSTPRQTQRGQHAWSKPLLLHPCWRPLRSYCCEEPVHPLHPGYAHQSACVTFVACQYVTSDTAVLL